MRYFICHSRILFAIAIVLTNSNVWTTSMTGEENRPNGSSAHLYPIFPEFAPGESSKSLGEQLPPRDTDTSVITRIEKVRAPSLDIFEPKQPNGTAVIILPGGGFGKVVTDLEGSEAAVWLNELGITAFVLRYRTNETKSPDEPNSTRPLQDVERAIRWVRSNVGRWKLDSSRIGILGFSAGGQVASVLHTCSSNAAYDPIDAIDAISFRPDFSLLIYPWNVWDAKKECLLPELQFSKNLPPAFIVHTSDDRSSAIGAAMIYSGLKKYEVPAELHIYETGGHGYGTRARPNSSIGTWTDRATDWLILRQLGTP